MEARHLLTKLIDEIGFSAQILAYRPIHVAKINLPPTCEAVAPVKAINVKTNNAPGNLYRDTQTAGFTPIRPGGRTGTLP